jgi:hypothetical protein
MTATDVTGVGPTDPIDDLPMTGQLPQQFDGRHRVDLFTPASRMAPAVVAALGGRPRGRVRHVLDLDALERVLKAAGFAVVRHGRSELVEAHRAISQDRTVSVLLTPRRAHQYVVYREFVDGVERPMRTEAGRPVGSEWQWHTMRSAVRRALAEVHIAGGTR